MLPYSTPSVYRNTFASRLHVSQIPSQQCARPYYHRYSSHTSHLRRVWSSHTKMLSWIAHHQPPQHRKPRSHNLNSKASQVLMMMRPRSLYYSDTLMNTRRRSFGLLPRSLCGDQREMPTWPLISRTRRRLISRSHISTPFPLVYSKSACPRTGRGIRKKLVTWRRAGMDGCQMKEVGGWMEMAKRLKENCAWGYGTLMAEWMERARVRASYVSMEPWSLKRR